MPKFTAGQVCALAISLTMLLIAPQIHADDSVTCANAATQDMDVCGNANVTSDIVSKANKDKNKKDNDAAKKETDKFIDAQYKKKVDKDDGSKWKRDKDFKDNTVTGQVYETYRGEYNAMANEYKDYAKKNCPNTKANAYSSDGACIDKFVAEVKKSQPKDASQLYKDMLDPSSAYGFKKMLSMESGKGTIGLTNYAKDERLEELLQKRAEQDSKTLLEADRNRIETAYKLKQAELDSKKEVMNKNGNGSQTKLKWDYKDLSFDQTLNLSKANGQVFLVDPGTEDPNTVIQDLYSRDPNVYGCHPYTNPPDLTPGTVTPDKPLPKKDPPESKTCQIDDCNLKTYFKDDVATFGADGDAAIQSCIDEALSKCGIDKSMVKSIHVEADSCASTVPSRKFASNLDLSKARVDFMKARADAQLAKMKSSYPGAELITTEDPSDYGGENLGLDGSPTGTCGPLPPEHIRVEPWGNPPSCSNTANMSKAQIREDLVTKGRAQAGVQCNGAVADKAGYDWLCNDAYKTVRSKSNDSMETKIKRYESVYSANRRSGLKIEITTKEMSTPPKDVPDQGGPSKTTPDPLAKNMIKCFKLDLDYASGGQQQKKVTITLGGRGPSSHSTGKNKQGSCWLNGSQGVSSDGGSDGKVITILKYKAWKMVNHRGDQLDADETDMWYGWGD